MNKAKTIFIAFVLFGWVGCATVPPPKPLDPQSAVIGISVKTRAPIKTFTDKPNVVYFINAEQGEDVYTQGNFIRSNYAKGGQVYLLNLKPGHYAAVGCYKRIIGASPDDSGICSEGITNTTFFPKELIKLTEVTVAPGTIAFMGKYVIDTSTGLKDADDAQLHYAQLIWPGALLSYSAVGTAIMVVLPVFTERCEYAYKGSLHEEKCDKRAEIGFLDNALEHFKGTGWINIIQKRMEELKAEK
jgi:hypothetical protein